MSLTFALILTASAAAASPPESGRWGRIVRAAHDMDVPTPRLFDALAAARATPRDLQPRYCFEDRLTSPEAPTKVCRTRAQWLAFGLEPVSEASGAG